MTMFGREASDERAIASTAAIMHEFIMLSVTCAHDHVMTNLFMSLLTSRAYTSYR